MQTHPDPSTETIDMSKLKEVSPKESVLVKPRSEESPLTKIGRILSIIVLCIISGYILLLVIMLFVKEYDASDKINISVERNISDSTFAQKIEVAKLIKEEKKNYRDFTLQISQMILLNLLLPILTAILGYIFASNKNKE